MQIRTEVDNESVAGMRIVDDGRPLCHRIHKLRTRLPSSPRVWMRTPSAVVAENSDPRRQFGSRRRSRECPFGSFGPSITTGRHAPASRCATRSMVHLMSQSSMPYGCRSRDVICIIEHGWRLRPSRGCMQSYIVSVFKRRSQSDEWSSDLRHSRSRDDDHRVV